MQTTVHIKMNARLFVHDPLETELGKKILQEGVILLHKTGLESFTFRKLALAAGTTEASVYRYFENKQRLLSYLVAWYWSWVDYRIRLAITNIREPEEQLKRIIRLLAAPVTDDTGSSYIDESLLHEIVVEQGAKAYLTKHVGKDNRMNFFKPYKDLCHFIGTVMLQCMPGYAYPHSLSSTLVEAAHMQKFFHQYLPSLTDFSEGGGTKERVQFLEDMVFSALGAAK